MALTLLVLLLGSAGAGALYLKTQVIDPVSLSDLKPRQQGRTSVVYAKDGTRLGVIGSPVRRSPVTGDQMAASVRDATVAIEDRRFYEHGGVDVRGIGRAAWRDVLSGSTDQGASTITQQLIRNLYITPERTWQRKVREIVLAGQLEQQRSKRDVLTSYLNNVPYGAVDGQQIIGIEAAARSFFGVRAADLTLAQSALLAGLPQAPSQLNPFEFRSAARARRNLVLDALHDQGKISDQAWSRARQSKIKVKHGSLYSARRESEILDSVERELTRRYGSKVVQQGGLRVTATIDLKLQQAARSSLKGLPEGPLGTIVSVDPRSGEIRALVGSASYSQAGFSLATQAHRQPGSTFKSVVLATALARGADPDRTGYISKPLTEQLATGPWTVRTFDGTYPGYLSLRQATLRSDNSVYAQLALDVTPARVRSMAHRLGITSELDAIPSESLGGLRVGVTPLEMARVYATFAADGQRRAPTLISSVRFPDGHVERPDHNRTRALSSGATRRLNSVLVDNVRSGTGTAAALPGCLVGGKTGTTSDFKDAWFVGYTARLSTSVWMGYRTPRPMSFGGTPASGAGFPASIWKTYMQQAVKRGGCGELKTTTKTAPGKFCEERQVSGCSAPAPYTPPVYNGGFQYPQPAYNGDAQYGTPYR